MHYKDYIPEAAHHLLSINILLAEFKEYAEKESGEPPKTAVSNIYQTNSLVLGMFHKPISRTFDIGLCEKRGNSKL